MPRIRNALLVLSVALVLSGCGSAGRLFLRPEPDSLVLGKTTRGEILSQFGKPFQEGTKLNNGVTLQMTAYSYAQTHAAGTAVRVIPAKSLVFHFSDGVLVGHHFTSSYLEDHTDFDLSKVGAIKKGTTTRDQVIGIFGPPQGAYIYPLLDARDGKGLVYYYQQTKQSGLSAKFYLQQLVVTLNSAGVVTDLDLTTTGQK